ncbi:hypothetical protein C5I_0135860 [Pseudomonas syringae pv. syringae FF5]|nr:hypothetical protein C5I_0135860 [Pseudomonas syringae pv. syringae FF5]
MHLCARVVCLNLNDWPTLSVGFAQSLGVVMCIHQLRCAMTLIKKKEHPLLKGVIENLACPFQVP